MSDNKERVYSEEDLCEYTILQKIEALEKQLQEIKSEVSTEYETKVEANTAHTAINGSLGLLNESLNKTNKTVDDLNKVTPTDVGIKDNKLGLLHDTTWLTNQGAINLDGFTYDETTKTLKASGGDSDVGVIELTESQAITLSASSKITFTTEQAEIIKAHQLIIIRYGSIIEYKGFVSRIYQQDSSDNYTLSIFVGNYLYYIFIGDFTTERTLNITVFPTEYTFTYDSGNRNIIWSDGDFDRIVHLATINGEDIAFSDSSTNKNFSFTEDKTISLFGKHSILVPKNSTDTNIDIYRHDICLDGGESYLYITYLSSSNLVVDSITDINTLLGTTERNISCSGTIALDGGTYVPASGIYWKGNFASSIALYTDAVNGEDSQTLASKFAQVTVKDTVITI